MWALGLGLGLCSAIPSLLRKQTVMVAWSKPGAAVLATAGLAGGFTMPQAVGTFMASAVLIALAGASGWFERIMNRIPMALASALPQFIVTMASQNLPGVVAIRAAGYDMPISKIITMTGVVTLVLAPFGAFALNLSAITAAICMGEEAHPDKKKRYTAAVACGAIYVLIGLFGAAVTGLLIAFPKELVLAIAGLALLGSIGGGLHAALREDSHREAALITFLVTLSGVVIAGIGSAFWGVVAGAIALFVQQYRAQKTDTP